MKHTKRLLALLMALCLILISACTGDGNSSSESSQQDASKQEQSQAEESTGGVAEDSDATSVDGPRSLHYAADNGRYFSLHV